MYMFSLIQFRGTLIVPLTCEEVVYKTDYVHVSSVLPYCLVFIQRVMCLRSCTLLILNTVLLVHLLYASSQGGCLVLLQLS